MPVEFSIEEINRKVADQAAFVQTLRTELAKRVVGQEAMVDGLLIGLLTNGHVLLEGVPGLAKTLTVSTLAQLIGTSFQRIQFTPDLLPGDVIGTLIYDPKEGDFRVKKGPVFASVILADEINRAPAKVQSALLEAMQERQVTIGDETFGLPDPFLVLATQNPIDQEGTYPLPEAQVDRFMLKLSIGYPTKADERKILDVMARTEKLEAPSAVIGPDEIIAARKVVDSIYMDDKIKDYVVDLVFATRTPEDFGLDIAPLLEYGASPRATINLTLAAKARAFLNGRGFVTPQDVKGRRARGHASPRHRLLRGGGRGTRFRRDRQPYSRQRGSAVIPKEILDKVRRIQIMTSRMVTDVMSGHYESVFKGRGMEFSEVRPYQVGDDVRAIDWNVTARTGSAHVKEYVEERELTVMILFDASTSLDVGTKGQTKREIAAELCAVLAFTAVRNNDKVGLIVFTDRIELFVPPKKGKRHVLRVIREILAHEAEGSGTDIRGALEYLSRVTRRKSVTFLVSDFLDEGYEKDLSIANSKHDLVAMAIGDPAEHELDHIPALLNLVDAESGAEVQVDGFSLRLRRGYAETSAAARGRRDEALKRRGIDTVELRTDRDYVAPLINYFRDRERRL